MANTYTQIHVQANFETTSFIEEYENLLKNFEIEYVERFVFKPVDYIVPACGPNCPTAGRPDGTS